MKIIKQIKQKGFTYVEFMVVLAIISVLTSMAMPHYHDYAIRAKVTEGFSVAPRFQRRIVDFYEYTERFPKDNKEAAAIEFSMTNYVKSMKVEKGAIQIIYQNIPLLLKNNRLSIRPAFVKGSPLSPIIWICGNAEVPKEFTVVGENKTNIREVYIPSACRG